MANRVAEEAIKECDKQLDSLYVHFGKFLYQNIEEGNIYYCFESENNDLEERANALLLRLKHHPAEEQIPVRQTGLDSPESGSADQESELQERKLVQKSGIGKRGLLEPYANLMIELHAMKKEIIELKEDTDECLLLAMLHISDTETEVLLKELQEVEDTVISSIANSMEVVRCIMTEKKLFSESSSANPDTVVWGAEDEFLKKAASDIENTGQQINILVERATGLFEKIEEAYKKDLERDKLLREKKLDEEVVGTESGSVKEEIEEIEKGVAEEKIEHEKQEEEQGGQEEEQKEQEEEKYDYGLLETASRKLKSEPATRRDRLRVLNTIFRTVPGKVADFLFDLIRDADLFLKKELLELLKEINSPSLVDLYRKFTSDGESLLKLHGIMGLRRLGSGEVKDVIVSASHDPDPQVRRLVANCLDYTGNDAEVAAIVRLANDADEAVARISIRKLGKVKNRFSFINLMRKLESPNVKVRKEAIDALQLMTGKDLGYDYSASESDRNLAVKSWERFWEKNLTNPHFLKEIKSTKTHKKTKKRVREKV